MKISVMPMTLLYVLIKNGSELLLILQTITAESNVMIMEKKYKIMEIDDDHAHQLQK